MYRRPDRKNKLMSEVNVINLVDVMLVLLILFILVAPILEQGISLRLPAAAPSPNRQRLGYADSQHRSAGDDLSQRPENHPR